MLQVQAHGACAVLAMLAEPQQPSYGCYVLLALLFSSCCVGVSCSDGNGGGGHVVMTAMTAVGNLAMVFLQLVIF